MRLEWPEGLYFQVCPSVRPSRSYEHNISGKNLDRISTNWAQMSTLARGCNEFGEQRSKGHHSRIYMPIMTKFQTNAKQDNEDEFITSIHSSGS